MVVEVKRTQSVKQLYFKTENKMDRFEKGIQSRLRSTMKTISLMLPRGIRKGNSWHSDSK